MRTVVKDGVVVLVPETPEERADLDRLRAAGTEHVFVLRGGDRGVSFHDLGPRAEACREPIAISSRSPDAAIRLISNFAPTPFDLDGVRYACVEAFWQSLKFDDPDERARIADLDGPAAKDAAARAPARDTIDYRGERVRFGARAHWDLMERACRAKFEQHARARRALLETGTRPLTHRMRRDSESIPGAIVCEIWMRIRSDLANAT